MHTRQPAGEQIALVQNLQKFGVFVLLVLVLNSEFGSQKFSDFGADLGSHQLEEIHASQNALAFRIDMHACEAMEQLGGLHRQ